MAEEQDRTDTNGVERPHDVLAADEFGFPTGKRRYADPHTDEHEAHDVLAADEFAMPTRSGYRRPDPHADEHEAHDVLAADEFAMPGGAEPHAASGGGTSPRWLFLSLGAVAAVIILLRRR